MYDKLTMHFWTYAHKASCAAPTDHHMQWCLQLFARQLTLPSSQKTLLLGASPGHAPCVTAVQGTGATATVLRCLTMHV
jgi:hypothetical protein